MDIAVFGGSFDPPHRGHKRVVEEAIKVLDIDKLFVIPTYLNPFKKSFYHDENTRLKLVKNMFKEYDKVDVLDVEISKKRAVPTYETITLLKKKFSLDKIYLIIGADNLENLSKWTNYDKLKDIVEFVIATRDDIEIPSKYKKLTVDEKISSTDIRRRDIE